MNPDPISLKVYLPVTVSSFDMPSLRCTVYMVLKSICNTEGIRLLYIEKHVMDRGYLYKKYIEKFREYPPSQGYPKSNGIGKSLRARRWFTPNREIS